MAAMSAVYDCTRLTNTGKKGILKQLDDGYYEIVVGGLDVFNSVGAFYDFESVKALFDQSGSLMRRMRSGQLRCEYGHPKWLPGMTMQDYINRLLVIDEANVCCHIRRVRLDNTISKNPNGKPIVTIIAELKPSGPLGHVLKEELDNPHENVSFSVRSLTNDRMVGGVLHKSIKHLICWDRVVEPGLAIAEKYKTPSLESLVPENIIVKPSNIVQFKKDIIVPGAGMESNASLEDLMSDLGWKEFANIGGISSRW